MHRIKCMSQSDQHQEPAQPADGGYSDAKPQGEHDEHRVPDLGAGGVPPTPSRRPTSVTDGITPMLVPFRGSGHPSPPAADRGLGPAMPSTVPIARREAIIGGLSGTSGSRPLFLARLFTARRRMFDFRIDLAPD